MNKSILIVDDQLAMRRMIQAALQGHNYDLALSADGIEAFEEATKKRFDLVITDFHMPRCNGIDLTKRLRKLQKYNGVPILVVSTESNAEKKGEGRAAGANGWIVKPVSPEKLVNAVKKLIN